MRSRNIGREPLPADPSERPPFFFYLALPFPIILFWDGLKAFNFDGEFGMGVGTVILLTNAILLGLYTFSCHSCRHLVGGGLRTLSGSPIRRRLWGAVTRLNARHPEIAWISLFGVALTDLYVRLLANNVITDLRLF